MQLFWILPEKVLLIYLFGAVAANCNRYYVQWSAARRDYRRHESREKIERLASMLLARYLAHPGHYVSASEPDCMLHPDAAGRVVQNASVDRALALPFLLSSTRKD
jgi:hypothetical protein